MNPFILKSLLFLFLASEVMAGGSKPGFTLRVHVQAINGGNPAQSIPMALRNPDQVINVNKYAVLTERNVVSLMKLPDGATLVTLDGTGQKIMETETTNNLGAVMVIICNGRLNYSPEIDAPLRSGKILIPAGPLGLGDADYALFRQYLEKRSKQ